MRPSLIRGCSKALFAALVLALVMLPSVALAGPPGSGGVDGPGPLTRILMATRGQAEHWIFVLQDAARPVFWSLAVIQLLWTGISQLTSGQTGFAAAAGAYAREIVKITLFSVLLEKGPYWGQDLIRELQRIGQQAAAATGVTVPQTILDDTVKLFVSEMPTLSLMGMEATALAVVLGLLILIVLFAVIGGLMVLAEVQAYVVLGAGAITLAFGGASWTRSLSLAYMRHAFAAGLKLMLLHLMQSLVLGHARGWVDEAIAQDGVELETLATMLSSAVVLCLMMLTLPDKLAAIVTGAATSQAESMFAGGAMALGLGAAAQAVRGARGEKESSRTAQAASGTGGAPSMGSSAPVSAPAASTSASGAGGSGGGSAGGTAQASAAAGAVGGSGDFAASVLGSSTGEASGSGAGGSESAGERGGSQGGDSPYSRFAPAPPSAASSAGSQQKGAASASSSPSKQSASGTPASSAAKETKGSGVPAASSAGKDSKPEAGPKSSSGNAASAVPAPAASAQAQAGSGPSGTAAAQTGGGPGGQSSPSSAEGASGGPSRPTSSASSAASTPDTQGAAARSAFGVESAASGGAQGVQSTQAAAGHGAGASRQGRAGSVKSAASAASSSAPTATATAADAPSAQSFGVSEAQGPTAPIAPQVSASAPALKTKPKPGAGATAPSPGPTPTQAALGGGSRG